MVFDRNLIAIFYVFLAGAQAVQVNDLFYCGFEQDRDFCGIVRIGRWKRESVGIVEGTGPQGNDDPNIGNGAKASNYFALMDADENEAGEEVAMLLDLESACRFRVDFFVYMYGKHVRQFILTGYNHVNRNWEPFLVYDRIGPLMTPGFKADEEFLMHRNNDSDGLKDWRNLWIQTNHHAKIKMIALNSKNPATMPLADIAVDELNVEVAWCPAAFQTTTPGQITRYTGLPTGVTRRTTITPEGTLLNIDGAHLPPFGNDFGGAYNSDLDDGDWSLGSASVFFQSSPPEHTEFLYVQDENLVTYGTVDLILPPIYGAKCLVLFYRLFQSPIMALYIMKNRDKVETTAYSVVISDPSEILVDWSKLSIDIDAQEGDQWFIRAVKQDLGETFRRGGHIEVDDITAYVDTCDVVNGARGAVVRDGSKDSAFKLPRRARTGASAASSSKTNEAEEKGAIAAAVMIPLMICILAGVLLFVSLRKKKSGPPPPGDEGYDPNNDPYAAGGADAQGIGGTSQASLAQRQSGTSVAKGGATGSASRGSFGASQMVSAAGGSAGGGASQMVSADGGSFGGSQMVSAAGESVGASGMVSAAGESQDGIVAQVPET